MQEAKTVAIHVVTWNSLVHLPNFFASLDAQDWNDWNVMAVDNASADGTLRWLQDERPGTSVLRNFRNQGRARAWNQAIAMTLSRWPEETWHDRFVMIASPNIELDPSCLSSLVRTLRADSELTACVPVILRSRVRSGLEGERRETERTGTIEAMGIGLSRTRRFVPLQHGREYHPESRAPYEVFGFSGTCVLIRASVLAQAKLGGEIFDEQFFESLEDIDLAWRLRRYGYRCVLDPNAVIWQEGGAAKLKSRTQRFYETRNRFWTIWKNDEIENVLLYAPWVFASCVNDMFRALFSWSRLAATFSAYGRVFSILALRRESRARVRIKGQAMRKWYTT